MQANLNTPREAAPAPHHPIRRTVADRLQGALAELAGIRPEFLSHSEKAWASITFTGTRHLLKMRFAGAATVEAAECFIAFLPEHEFTIPNQLVADAAVTEVEHSLTPEPVMLVTCELLLLDEA